MKVRVNDFKTVFHNGEWHAEGTILEVDKLDSLGEGKANVTKVTKDQAESAKPAEGGSNAV